MAYYQLQNEVSKANFNTGKRIYNWPPFMKVVYTSDSPYSGVVPTPAPSEPRTHKCTVFLPGNFHAIFYGSRLDPFGFKIFFLALNVSLNLSIYYSFNHFWQCVTKILSSGYCVTDKFTISACNMLGFCTLCFYFATKMLHLNAPVFPLKCSVSPKNVTKMLG